MRAYPFDSQTCSMTFIMQVNSKSFDRSGYSAYTITFKFQGNSGNFVKLVKNQLNYLGPVDLTQYFVKSFNIHDDNERLKDLADGNKGVIVNFNLSRRLLNQILTVFMPTIVICIISFTTSFFMVNLTYCIQIL